MRQHCVHMGLCKCSTNYMVACMLPGCSVCTTRLPVAADAAIVDADVIVGENQGTRVNTLAPGCV